MEGHTEERRRLEGSDLEQQKTQTSDRADANHRAASQGRQKLKEVQTIYARMGLDLEGDRFWRYERQVSPGVQEYVEALSLVHFLEHGTLITYDQTQETLSDPSTGQLVRSNVAYPTQIIISFSLICLFFQFFPLPVLDYLMGISDLTGELMRYAISGLGYRGGRTTAQEVCAFVRACKNGKVFLWRLGQLWTFSSFNLDLELLVPYHRDLARKQIVTMQSLEKIENGESKLSPQNVRSHVSNSGIHSSC